MYKAMYKDKMIENILFVREQMQKVENVQDKVLEGKLKMFIQMLEDIAVGIDYTSKTKVEGDGGIDPNGEILLTQDVMVYGKLENAQLRYLISREEYNKLDEYEMESLLYHDGVLVGDGWEAYDMDEYQELEAKIL